MKNYCCLLQFFLAFYFLCACTPSQPGGNAEASPGKAGKKENWRPLFNHENLQGWHTLPGGKWEVKDGLIVGTSPAAEPLHGILISDKAYGDFKLKVIYKAIKGNSGLYFRVDKVAHAAAVFGFQAEIDPEKDAGGLYETGGRAWVVQPTPTDVQKWYKPDAWNEMTVVAKGKDIVVYLNGYKTADLKNDPGRTQGYIGLQLHGGMDMHVQFKEVLIIENPGNMENR